METDLDRSMQPEQHHTSAAGGVIHRRVMIKSEPSVMMANYNKIKRVKPLWSCIAMAVERNQNLKVQEDIEEIGEKTKEAEERGSRKAR